MDYIANREWLTNLYNNNDDNYNNNNDNKLHHQSSTLIIIAGDISHNLDILHWTFTTLKSKFAQVVYTPGNHELWVTNNNNNNNNNNNTVDQDYNNTETSLDKLEKVLELCIQEGIHIGPVKLSGGTTTASTSSSSSSVLVIPLLSWHHPSFDTELDIIGWGNIPSAKRANADYRRTNWPLPLSHYNDSIAEFVDSINDVILDLENINDNNDNMEIITFSHFLPRIELIPEKRYMSLPTLASFVGSTYLEQRLRRIRNQLLRCNDSTSNSIRHLHAFGHSHLAWDAIINNARYVHVPLAYPREWKERSKSLEIGSMKGDGKAIGSITTTTTTVTKGGRKTNNDRIPVCIWERRHPAATANTKLNNSAAAAAATTTSNNEDGGSGFPPTWLGGWWSKYYSFMERQPQRNNELASWVAKRYKQLPGGKIVDFDHITIEKKSPFVFDTNLVGMAACICSAADSELPVCDPYRTSISSVSVVVVIVPLLSLRPEGGNAYDINNQVDGVACCDNAIGSH
jgi:hypothetical protein